MKIPRTLLRTLQKILHCNLATGSKRSSNWYQDLLEICFRLLDGAKKLPSPLHHHQIKSKFRMASFRSPKAARSRFCGFDRVVFRFSFLSIPLLLLYTVVVMTKPILVFSTETVGANTFSSADVGYFLASFQPFNTHWNSKAKVSSQHTCSKGSTLIPPPSD